MRVKMLPRILACLGITASTVLLGGEAWARRSHGCKHNALASCSVCAPAVPTTLLVPHQETVMQTFTKMVCEQTPVTTTVTRYHTELKTEQVPFTRFVCEQVPVQTTRMVYHTEMQTLQRPVTQFVCETNIEPRTTTFRIPKCEIVPQQVTSYVCEPVQTTTIIKQCYTVMKPIQRTIYKPNPVTTIVNKTVTRFVPQCVTVQQPVTTPERIVEQHGEYVTRLVPVCARQGIADIAGRTDRQCPAVTPSRANAACVERRSSRRRPTSRGRFAGRSITRAM